jgi:aspartyl-tRNA synthetase
MPQGGLEALKAQDPLTIKAFQYDIVCNGFEIASGGSATTSPRHGQGLRDRRLEPRDVEESFGGMYRAFQYGAPPHGGMAPASTASSCCWSAPRTCARSRCSR